jgi:hypothetical protein
MLLILQKYKRKGMENLRKLLRFSSFRGLFSSFRSEISTIDRHYFPLQALSKRIFWVDKENYFNSY